MDVGRVSDREKRCERNVQIQLPGKRYGGVIHASGLMSSPGRLAWPLILDERGPGKKGPGRNKDKTNDG